MPLPFILNLQEKNYCLCKKLQNWYAWFASILETGYKPSVAYVFLFLPKSVSRHMSVSVPNIQNCNSMCHVQQNTIQKEYLRRIVKCPEIRKSSIKVALITRLQSIFSWNPHLVAVHYFIKMLSVHSQCLCLLKIQTPS